MRVPKYSLHRPTGQAYVRIQKRCHYLGVHNSTKSKERYRRLIAEYLETGILPVTRDESKPLEVRELILKFTHHAKKYYGLDPNSQWLRMKPALKSLRHLFGTLPVTDYGPQELKLTRSYIGKESKRSREYVNRLTRYVVQVFRWGNGEGLVPASVPQALANLATLKSGRCDLKETEAIKPVADELVNATLMHLSPVVKAMIELQRLTGARPGEVCGLKPPMVERNSDVWEIHLDKHKTAWRGKKRVIYVGQDGQKVLMPYLLRPADAYCFDPREAIRKLRPRSTPISQGNRIGYGGNRKPKTNRKVRENYTTGSYGNAIRRACRKHQIEEWSPNQLRHSFATEVRRTDGLEVSSILLGHSDLVTTQIYAEADQSKAREAVRRRG